ncbi:MAG: hypothetical protein Faunusvirus6_22 [Faunusvirus sp.]|jgi:tetratricopeptide (TPR) repeat protein|uniref:Uncharacterized protein n=1 Tax=Faunusvirus sp. TaxID=2487766 RepID=A0A3G4ZY54_9VIRU|nr:MAG: hypothetical protein Faunusvirus6_22 [Faunusvirus sp.]
MTPDYIAEIKNYLQANSLGYIELKNSDDIKMVHGLLINGKIAENITNVTNSTVHVYYGAYFYTTRNYSEMKKYYEIAIQHNNTFAMVNMALYYKDVNDTKNMLRYFNLAIDHRFDDRKFAMTADGSTHSGPYIATINIGNYYFKDKQYHDTLKYYHIAAELEPNNGSLMYSIGSCYQCCGDLINMMKYFDMAIELGDHIDTILTYYINNNSTKYKFVECCKKLIENGHTEYITTFGNYYLNTQQYSAGFEMFTNLHKVGHTNISYFLAKYLSHDHTMSTEFIDKYFALHDTVKAQDETIKTQTEYIEQLELMPEGPKYAEAKAHFNASVELLENSVDF